MLDAVRSLDLDGRLLFVTRFVRLFAYGALSVVLVLYLVGLGFSEADTGVLLTATLLGDTLVSLYLTTQADRIGRRRTLIAGAGLMVAAGLAFAFTREMFSAHFLAMIVAVVAVLIARAVAVFGLLSLPLGKRDVRVPVIEQTVVVWGGLRGGVALALVLSLPFELESWFTLQSMAYGVVLFTLLVQAPTLPLLMRFALRRR